MKTGLKILPSIVCALALVGGCRAPLAGSGIPAVIIQPTEASRAALKNLLSGLFGGREIDLAADALTRSSWLSLQPAWQQKSADQPALGRVVTKPFSFRLIRIEEDCFLVDMRDGESYLLTDTRCVPE